MSVYQSSDGYVDTPAEMHQEYKQTQKPQLEVPQPIADDDRKGIRHAFKIYTPSPIRLPAPTSVTLSPPAGEYVRIGGGKQALQ